VIPVDELDAAAFRAWPAAEQVDRDGWVLRASAGLTRRGNSAWPRACRGRAPLHERIAAVESFYSERGLPPRFQISQTAEPKQLDDVLAASGYVVEAPVSVRAAPIEGAIALLPDRGEVVATVSRELSEMWLDVAVRGSRFASEVDGFVGFARRIGERALFALAVREAEPIAAALGVVEGAWLGLFAMFTLREHRRCGAARELARALGRSALERGARWVYHQTDHDNLPALTLSEEMGLQQVYRYHYRLKR